MSKYKTIIKLISADFTRVVNGAYAQFEERINSKKPLKKVIKICLKYDLPFRVSIRGKEIIENMNYIEILNAKLWREKEELKEVLL